MMEFVRSIDPIYQLVVSILVTLALTLSVPLLKKRLTKMPKAKVRMHKI